MEAEPSPTKPTRSPTNNLLPSQQIQGKKQTTPRTFLHWQLGAHPPHRRWSKAPSSRTTRKTKTPSRTGWSRLWILIEIGRKKKGEKEGEGESEGGGGGLGMR